mgnify:CR=1 FL=1
MGLVQYLDNGLFQTRNKDKLKQIIGRSDKNILTTGVLEEVINEGKWIMERGSSEEKALYADIFSKEGEIIHPKIEVSDYTENPPYKKAAEYYFKLISHRKNVLSSIEDSLREEYKDHQNIEGIIKKTRNYFHNKLGTRLYTLCKKGTNNKKRIDENMIINFLFDAATNCGDYFLFSDDFDVFDQFINLYELFYNDKISYNFSVEYSKNPGKYKRSNLKSSGEFVVEISKEDFERIIDGPQNRVFIEIGDCIRGGIKDYYSCWLPHDCDDFLKVRGETGRNTNLFGDLTCHMMRGEKKYAYFNRGEKNDSGLYIQDISILIDRTLNFGSLSKKRKS